jgi:Ca-activated chloride channel homolog
MNKPDHGRMTRKKVNQILLLLILAVLSSTFLRGMSQSTPQAAEEPIPDAFTIGVEVNMVTVPVTVRHPEGGFVQGLSKDSFVIHEDGKPQEIILFTQEKLPVHMALVLDTSGSVRPEWGSIKNATNRFLEYLAPDDRFSITTFDEEIRLRMDWGKDTDRVDTVLTSVYCKGMTKLWDALWVVSNEVFREIEGKKAIIIMSDGLDNDSFYSFKDALRAVVQSDAAVYVVSKVEAIRQMISFYYDRLPQQELAVADAVLHRIAYETGGRVIYPNDFGKLDDVYEQVNEELRNQYTLGYISTNTTKDGSYRHISVGVAIENGSVSARPGYYAPSR